MKKRNIYQNRSQELYSLFQDAGNNSKIMFIQNGLYKKVPYSDVLLDKKQALILHSVKFISNQFNKTGDVVGHIATKRAH